MKKFWVVMICAAVLVLGATTVSAKHGSDDGYIDDRGGHHDDMKLGKNGADDGVWDDRGGHHGDDMVLAKHGADDGWDDNGGHGGDDGWDDHGNDAIMG